MREEQLMIDFYNSYLKRVDNSLSLDDILTDNTDGIVNGNILEFKMTINDINSVLFQAIKYLSAQRIKGKEIPKNILLISLLQNIVYVFDSGDYIKDIEKVYIGGASKNTNSFKTSIQPDKLDLSNAKDVEKLINFLKQKQYTKINIDENCIVAWAERYYKQNPTATKGDFIGDETGKRNVIGEIRQPKDFKEFINPYKGESNIKFQYLMDKLNDKLHTKMLGAFYTPQQYVKKSYELLRDAISKVPKENDYIILDRCAGTGNLERFLTDEELSHCVVSTIEYYEYKVLLETIGDKVRHVIPPIEEDGTFNKGFVDGADALSEEYFNNEILREYIDNPNCNIILFENPPYSEVNGNTFGKKSKAEFKNSYIYNLMDKEITGVAKNDIANVFIWSGFKYYLTKPHDSYILFSPIKYWKSQHLIKNHIVKGFGFNRKFFHAKSESCITCLQFNNEKVDQNEITLEAYNIDKEGNMIQEEDIKVRKVYSLISKYYDNRKFPEDKNVGIACENKGDQSFRDDIRVQQIDNQNIIGYLVANQQGFEQPRLNSILTTRGHYGGHGFFLRDDMYFQLLPLFAAGKYTDMCNDWKVMGILNKSADGYDKYWKNINDKNTQIQLTKILFWTCLTHYNHMLSFISDKERLYINNLTLDVSNGDTVASQKLKESPYQKELSGKEKEIYSCFKEILEIIPTTKNYNPKFTYGLYQISEELNTNHKDPKTDKTIYDYPGLNTKIKEIKPMLKEYYIQEIVPFLFKYEFLK